MSSESALADMPPGTPVGEYQIVSFVGQGGMGTVYRGIQPQIGKQVAIKVLAAHATEDLAAGARFLREAQVVNRIGHPGLVDIFSFGQLPSGRHYLIMELLQGEPLAARLLRGPFSWREILDIFGQILSALQAAHEHGVVHRDLKPDNIHLTGSADAPRVKLLDFGLAKDLDAENAMTQTGIALGTPRYMAPEQSRGGKYVDHRADLYAVGLMMYEALTGRFPFEAPTPILLLSKHLTELPEPPSRFARMPPALEEVVLRALVKDPATRYQSAAAMGAALREVAPPSANMDLSRLPPGPMQTAGPPSRPPSQSQPPTQPRPSRPPSQSQPRPSPPSRPSTPQPAIAMAAVQVPSATLHLGEFTGEDTRLSPQRGSDPRSPRGRWAALLRSRQLLVSAAVAVLACGAIGAAIWYRTSHGPLTIPAASVPGGAEPAGAAAAPADVGTTDGDPHGEAPAPPSAAAQVASKPRKDKPKPIKRPPVDARHMAAPF